MRPEQLVLLYVQGLIYPCILGNLVTPGFGVDVVTSSVGISEHLRLGLPVGVIGIRVYSILFFTNDFQNSQFYQLFFLSLISCDIFDICRNQVKVPVNQ